MTLIYKKSIKRAMRAMKCAAFNLIFYQDAKSNGLDAQKVFFMREKYSSNKSKWFKSSEEIEDDFRWFIKIGILRREVDGQGLTSRIRLTPLGRQIIENNPYLFTKKTLLAERIANCFVRIMLLK